MEVELEHVAPSPIPTDAHEVGGRYTRPVNRDCACARGRHSVRLQVGQDVPLLDERRLDRAESNVLDEHGEHAVDPGRRG